MGIEPTCRAFGFDRGTADYEPIAMEAVALHLQPAGAWLECLSEVKPRLLAAWRIVCPDKI